MYFIPVTGPSSANKSTVHSSRMARTTGRQATNLTQELANTKDSMTIRRVSSRCCSSSFCVVALAVVTFISLLTITPGISPRTWTLLKSFRAERPLDIQPGFYCGANDTRASTDEEYRKLSQGNCSSMRYTLRPTSLHATHASQSSQTHRLVTMPPSAGLRNSA